MSNNSFGGDLASLNLQRGRDHGLAPYIHYLKVCGLGDIKTWDDLLKIIPDTACIEELKGLYKEPGDIDLFAGGMSEEIVSGGRVGPTFRCMIVDTMRRVRDGDRYWYEAEDEFTASQLSELKKVSAEKIFCDNGDNIM